MVRPPFSSSSLVTSPLPPPTLTATPPGQRILCWIPFKFTSRGANSSKPAAIPSETQIQRILLTYAPLCDKFHFVTQHGNETIFGVPTNNNVFLAHNYERQTGRDLWNQVSRGWHAMASSEYLDAYDWFIKLDADTVLIPGNLRLALNKYDADSERYFGHTIFEQSRPVHDVRAQFNVGAGYGVSRGLLRAMKPYLLRSDSDSTVPVDKRCVDLVRWGEDVKFGDCVRVVRPALLPERMKDQHDRELFYPFEPWAHMVLMRPGQMDWFWRGKDLNHTRWRFGSLTSRPVLFHHIKHTREFYGFDYLFHRVGVDPQPVSDNNNNG